MRWRQRIDAMTAPGPEERLLLACARGEPVRWPLHDGLRRDRLLRLASAHRAAAMLYDRLGAVDGVPADLLAALRAQAVAGAVRGMRLTGELVRLLEAFRNRGIQALPFKGPLLAAQLYGDRALREFSDLDILVRTAVRERAIAFPSNRAILSTLRRMLRSSCVT